MNANIQADLELIRVALHTGQASAAKVDAQRAFERVSDGLNQTTEERPFLTADERDAQRLIDASLVLAALPTIMSEQARANSVLHLRGVLRSTPCVAPVMWSIVRHLESPGSE